MCLVDTAGVEDEAARALLAAGARFAFVHGSRAGTPGNPAPAPRPDSDLDVAAWWGEAPPDPWDVLLAAGVDLIVLDSAPLWLAGRVAMWGRVLCVADDQADVERVRWQVDTRLVYLDELPAMRERYARRARDLAAGLFRTAAS